MGHVAMCTVKEKEQIYVCMCKLNIFLVTFFFFFSRKRTKIRKKTKYTILDNIDEQERMELRPKYGKSNLFHLGFI